MLNNIESGALRENKIEIQEGNLQDLKAVYAALEEEFAPEERKNFNHLAMLMKKGNYKLLLAKDKSLGTVIGYAFIYEIDSIKALWLDYMAIMSKFQNAGYGTALFNKIAEWKKGEVTGIFIEVEIPQAKGGESRENQLRRIRFYERLGAKRLMLAYELPTLRGGFPMHLYFHPASDTRVLYKEQIRHAIASAFSGIHSDIPQKESVLKSFYDKVQDEYFEG